MQRNKLTIQNGGSLVDGDLVGAIRLSVEKLEWLPGSTYQHNTNPRMYLLFTLIPLTR